MTPTLSSLAASWVIIMTTSGATSDDKVDMTTLDFSVVVLTTFPMHKQLTNVIITATEDGRASVGPITVKPVI